jgi:hypothetical protein
LGQAQTCAGVKPVDVGLRLEVVILLVGLRLEVVILLVGLIDNIFGFIDNICVSFGETLFQQVVGILI